MILNEKLKSRRVILASRSPRRRQLMEDCGIEFELADSYEVEEVYPEELTPLEVPLYLARLKSESYPHKLTGNDILITADTVVIHRDNILGKPSGREEAIEMLNSLSGSCHTVVTGVVLRSADKFVGFNVRTDVWFRRLRDEEIEYYVDNFRPYDKAGAYGIQEWIGYIGIGRIEGSFYNVMGLPIQTLYVNLEKFVEE